MPDSISLKRVSLPKTPTYIEGLDEILEGGLPQNRITLLVGTPGSGKTVLGTEFLYRGALNNQPGIFLGFEESAAVLRQNALTMGWDLAHLEKDNRLFILEGRFDPTTVISGEFSLQPLLAIIAGKAREIGASRIVLDALDVLLRLFEDPMRIRAELHILNDWLATCGMTAVMTLKPRQSEHPQTLLDFFYSMADCALVLDTRVVEQIAIRRLRVVKYRGSGFGRNEYPYIITSSGVKTIPVSAVALKHKPFGPRISSGVPSLDQMLGGGYFRASCILIAGEPGTGKTLLASSFTRQVCSQGEKMLYVSYEESTEALLNNITSAGINLYPYTQNGLLRVETTMPEALGGEEHLLRLMEFIEEFSPKHVVVDAISACQRMGGKQVAYEFLMRLLNFLKEKGITTILTNQTSGSQNQLEISGNGISSMVDVVILVKYIPGQGETNRILQVLKFRGSGHSNQWREYKITSNGLNVLDVYADSRGVLTGTARHVQQTHDTLETKRRKTAILAKEKEIASLQATQEMETARLSARLEAAQLELEALKLEHQYAQAETRYRASVHDEESTSTDPASSAKESDSPWRDGNNE